MSERLTLEQIDSMTDDQKKWYISDRKKRLNAPTDQEVEDLLDWVIENGGIIEPDIILSNQIEPDGYL